MMLFYTNATIMVKSVPSTKNKYGVVTRDFNNATTLAILEADIQPVSAAYIKRTYGKELETSFEVLTDSCEFIMPGNYIVVANVYYEIIDFVPYSFDNEPGSIFQPICQFLVKRVD